jgi:murein DD-endopeptidase MepM/ murein hydrolase activator NlpD
VQRVPGTTSTIRALLVGLLASSPVWFITGTSVQDTMASSELRTSTTAPTAATPVSVSAPLSSEDDVQIRHLISTGETFSTILAGRGLSATEVQTWQQAGASAYDIEAIQPGHALMLTFTRDQGQLRACEYEIDKYALLSMRLVHGQIQARLKAMPQLAAVRGVAGRVEASLATSVTSAGIPARMVSELADAFGWELDLQNDVRPGDQFRLVYAELRDQESGAERPGDILAAEITSGGRTFTALRFEDENGDSEYYDPDGNPLGRRFLKYPLDFVAITSQFSDARMHPVLKRFAPHLGVDFAAPVGTPVRAVASGIVTFAGRAGGYGNQVGLEHQSPYGSSYSHLRRIARGVRVGTEVQKGQVIGYVGRSGMATGPHLHFMLFRDGTYIDPLTVKLPASEELTGARRSQFDVLRQELLDRLAGLGRRIDLPALSLFSPANLIRSKLSSSLD